MRNMADYEKGLLARVLFKRELQDVIDRRIEPKMLADEKSRKAFEFILDFYKKYGDVPSIDLVEQEFPELKLDYAKEPVGYYIDKLVEQYVRNRGSYILTENARLLVTNPMNGLEMLRSEFARLTVEANPTRDVNLVETMNDRKKRYLELKNLKGIDGYPTPWQVLNEACVTGDSMIYDVETGKMVRMDDFCKGNFNSVLSFTSDGIREKMVSFKGRVTDKECLKIKTNSGHEIEGTYEHPVLTPSGWKRLDEVEIGENIAVVSRYPEPKNVVKIPDEHVDLIALLLSEGYISDGHVSVSNTDPEIIEVIRKSAEKMGCVVKQYGRSWNIVFGGRPERKHRGKRGRFTKDRIHPVQKMIDEYGIKRVTADKKEIPDVIFRLNNEQLRRFIAVFWSGDGYVNCCNKGRRGENVIVGINLTSKKMIQQLRTLLLRFGIVTHYMEVPQRNERWKMQYRLLVPTEFHEKFLNTFDLLGRRGVVLKERLSRRKFEHRTKLRLSDEIKNNLRRRFEEKKSLGGAGSSGKGVIAKIRKCVDKNFESFEGCFVRRKGERSNVIEKRMLKAMLEVLDVQDYMWVVNDDIHWVEVVSIERTGVKTVYDVTVPGTHCFIANDVVVHNTMGWHPGEFISIVSRPAVGKSAHFLTKVETDGGRIPIKDIKPGMKVVTYNEERQKIEYGVVNGLVDSGVKKEFRVRTRFGKVVRVSEEHPFLTPMGWKAVETGLKVGDQIAVPKFLPDVETLEVPIEEVELLALMLADGGVTSSLMSYSKKIPEMIGVAKRLAEYYGTELVPRGDGCSWYFKNGLTNEARQVIRRYGLDGLRGDKKFIPDEVFRMKKPLKKRFIELLVSGDGSVMKNYIEYSSTSEELVRGLGNLLLRFGIKYQIRERKPWFTHKGERREGKKVWVLTVRGDDAQKFMDEFDVVESKAKRFEGGTDDRNYVNIRLSEQQLDEIWSVFNGRLKELTKALGYKLYGKYQEKGYISKSKLRKKGLSQKNCRLLYEKYGVESLRIAATDELVFEDIVEIEELEPVQMYDIEVSNGHNFVADDVVVHNTFMLVVFAEYAWANGLNVLFINNEMSEEQIGKRFDAVHFKLPYKEFRAGLLPDELEKRYFEGLQELEGENPIWVISDVSGVMSIASKIDQYKPDIVMIDGMYLLNDDRKGDSRWERVTNVSRDLKKLAQQKRVPIIATTQFNRATDETRVERVTLSNIGFSDSLGQDSDIVLGLFRTRDMELNNEMLVRMLKVREGQPVDFSLLWDLRRMEFKVIATQDENQFILNLGNILR
jgi:replicative DNA helicase